MKRRTFAKTAATLAAAFVGGKASAQTEAKKPCACTFRQAGNNITLYVDGAKKTKVMFVADTHISYSDGLVEPYLDYAYRMHKAFASEPKMEALAMSLKSAKKSGCELAILGGDIINFPSEYNIKKLAECMANSEIPCRYIAGNHDWHFEGSGPDIPQPELRRKWIGKLAPLYAGENPDGYAVQLGGVNFVIIDNSANEISKEQLAFFKGELARGMPTILCAHIPLYVQGGNLGFSCGNPNFREATDRSYRVERRHKRPERETPETFEFRDTAFAAPNLLGVFAGHTHRPSTDFECEKFQVVTAKYLPKFDYLTIEIEPK